MIKYYDCDRYKYYSKSRRIYGCLHDLRLEENISPLAKRIALGQARTTNLKSVYVVCKFPIKVH